MGEVKSRLTPDLTFARCPGHSKMRSGQHDCGAHSMAPREEGGRFHWFTCASMGPLPCACQHATLKPKTSSAAHCGAVLASFSDLLIGVVVSS